jgi:hypothetical protein
MRFKVATSTLGLDEDNVKFGHQGKPRVQLSISVILLNKLVILT